METIWVLFGILCVCSTLNTCQVLDEADRLLDLDFGPTLDKILKVIPRERTTYLFSATMTSKVAKLQRASLSNPVRVEVSGKYVNILMVHIAQNNNMRCIGTKLYQRYFNTTSSRP